MPKTGLHLPGPWSKPDPIGLLIPGVGAAGRDGQFRTRQRYTIRDGIVFEDGLEYQKRARAWQMGRVGTTGGGPVTRHILRIVPADYPRRTLCGRDIQSRGSQTEDAIACQACGRLLQFPRYRDYRPHGTSGYPKPMKLTPSCLSVLECLSGYSSPRALRVRDAMRAKGGRPSWLIGAMGRLERNGFIRYVSKHWEATDTGRAAVGLPEIAWPADVVVVDCAGPCKRTLAVDRMALPPKLRKVAALVLMAGRIKGRPHCAACLEPGTNAVSGLAGGHPRSPTDDTSPWTENAVRALEG